MIRDVTCPEQQKRFEIAIDSVVGTTQRVRSGIGMQKEKSLHAILKNYIDPDPLHQEVCVGQYIADIYDKEKGKITEIQTTNFGALRQKLSAFLCEYQVTILYPIPRKKLVTWIDPNTGGILSSHFSPVRGSFYDVFRELYRINSFLHHPNLIVEPLLIDMTEFRLQDGFSRNGKKGSHRFDRIPKSLEGDLVLREPEDYAVFLPKDDHRLPEPFTAKDFENVVGKNRKVSSSTILRILAQLGVVERLGTTKNRAYQYRILMRNSSGVDFCKVQHN